jgi:4-hydroxy-3-methylbut-2-enyl diphosphate reductase
MKIIRAEHLGMCFGVRDAIDLAHSQAASGPFTILGDLVHNETVLTSLRARGIEIRRDAADIATATVMITAHGAAERTINKIKQRGLNVLQATCPLVQTAHSAVEELVKAGFHPVIIGQRDHVEVRGLTGDLEEFDVVLSGEDIAALLPRARFGVAAQTTQPIEKVRQLVSLLREYFPASEVRFVDTVCRPTKQRQSAAVELARQCDVVVVVGGAHSNNTRELCARIHHVQTAEDLRDEWLAGAETVGITAGTSTPDTVIDEVETRLRQKHGAPMANSRYIHAK